MIAECNDEVSIASSIKPCYFDIETLGICGQSPYGYTDPLQPCVLIKFNKVSSNLVFAYLLRRIFSWLILKIYIFIISLNLKSIFTLIIAEI